MDHVLFLDIEVNRKGKIVDFGAIFKGQELHESHATKLEQWISEANIICGHNIIAHDVPELKKIVGEDVFRGKKYIDTLLWSPILFSENPYHKLVKGYKIVNESEANNPLSDCKLTRELLMDELNAFNVLSDDIKAALFLVLSDKAQFKDFFDLYGQEFQKDSSVINKLLYGKICDAQSTDALVRHYPIELAYALSLFLTDNAESILPIWVKNAFPKSEELIEHLRFTSCEKDTCLHCSTKLNPRTSLLNFFGYDNFRKFDETRLISLQEETVRAGLQNKSFVAVFPTGGGKSLTFQLPALMRGECTRHLTVVISPLVSLMKDQVDNLQDRFSITRAVAINGLLSPLERNEAFERVETGSAHILYLSPESLRSPSIYRLISSRSIARFVIDEAHCFSSWGQDFRVDYLYIADFIKMLQKERGFGQIPVSCFTATAKPQVIEDIKSYFESKLGVHLDEFVTNKGRTNLSYEVINVEDSTQKMRQLLPLLERCEKPAIIYASRTKMVEKVAAFASEAGFEATFFHGQLDKERKKENMASFMKGQKEVIVATSAFGMGVDKDDVKTVIHYNISDSLENYIQEAGRAGRKETIQAKCYILFSESDLNKHFSLLQQTKINKNEIQDIWRALKSQAKRRTKLSQSALEIAKSAGWDTEIRELETRVTAAISTLEDRGFLRRNQNSPQVFADSLMVPSFAKGHELIQASNRLTEQDKTDCVRVFQRIIKDDEARLDYIADRTELKINRVQNAIRFLRDLKILGDAKDLTAFINLNRSKNSSKVILSKYIKLELALLKVLSEGKNNLSIRHLNQKILDTGITNTSIELIFRLLNYWEKRNFISKKRVDREREMYEIRIKDKKLIHEDVLWRHDLSGSTYKLLKRFQKDQNLKSTNKEDLPVSFSLLELKNANSFMGQIEEENTRRYELTLLFLNEIQSIKLEGGFMVTYNRLNVDEVETNRTVFTNADYEKMEGHYLHKTEQIHIVGEYAKKCIENYDSAINYVNDYFTLDYESFLAKYFPNRSRRKELRRPLTPARFNEIVMDLDTDQTNVMTDNKSEKVLVLAGPGSGKTKVLVHKIANLLLLEDIKPEQFLMLTFSKAASMEFKFRTRKLVPEFAGLIKITTFHGFCFELLGQLGDLKKSENIIRDCIDAIRNKTIDSTSIANKSVLMLDEVQDINEQEWELINTILEVANSIRVVAVGDDDQNIYSFRGSSNEYMNLIRNDENTATYSLIKNYRSREGIIQFNNRLLSTISSRMKSEELIPAKKTLEAKLSLTKYDGKYMYLPLVKTIAQSNLEGTKAVLVRTNYEALLVSTQLEELGIRTRLLAGFEGFSMSLLSEVRWFSNLLEQNVNESGLIFENDWSYCLEQFQMKYASTPHYKTCSEIFNKFHQFYPDKKLLPDWRDFIREIKMEDAIHGDRKSVIVSTMHKSKGKEFDHVWLLVDRYETITNESKRLLYVACSRAKTSLNIHTNIDFFDDISVDGMTREHYRGELDPPRYYELILNHRDVNLNSQKYSRALNTIQDLLTGDLLQSDTVIFAANEAPGLASARGGNVLLFSREFIENRLDSFVANGYTLVSARVEYLVYWYDKDEDKEYKIVLPRLRFERDE